MTKTKIMLTKKEAEAIERYKKEIVKSLEMQLKNPLERTPYEWAEPLVELGAEQILDSIQYGYEVEPEFKIGDKVFVIRGVVTDPYKVYEITDLDGKYANLKGLIGAFALLNLRHATPEEAAEYEERRKWAVIGREVGEIREGDIGVGNSGLKMICKHEIEKAYALNSLIGFYPTESYVCLLDGGADE